MLRMANAASAQAVEIGKEKLREFLESAEGGRQPIAVPRDDSDGISLRTLDSKGKKRAADDEDDDI
jgi:hypothetical protein